MIHKAGAGPKPIPHKELSVENLRDAIMFAISPSAKEAAKKMAHQIHEDVSISSVIIILNRPNETTDDELFCVCVEWCSEGCG
jgi:UDP:flavonoid glycosyltransferase YjiC (YdhE family)